MNVTFMNTTSDKLTSLDIVNGQLVALSDKAGIYYDMNDTRYAAVSQGDSSNYGLVKVSDNIDESAGTAESGVSASSYALVTAMSQIRDEIKDSLEWKLVITTAGTTETIALPEDYNELCIEVQYWNTSGLFNIPRASLLDTEKYYIAGFYGSETSTGYFYIAVSLTTLRLYEIYFQGADVLASCTVDVYAR